MKKVLLPLVLMVLLSVLASAENDSVTIGPYKVSFDLGLNHSDYNVTTKEPTETEDLSGNKSTSSSVIIQNNTGFMQKAVIQLTHYDTDQATPTIGELVTLTKLSLIDMQDTSNVNVAARVIDGVKGVAASNDRIDWGDNAKQYWATYYPAFDSKRLRCMILSSFPWDSGTLQLLKTIHIEKLNTTK